MTAKTLVSAGWRRAAERWQGLPAWTGPIAVAGVFAAAIAVVAVVDPHQPGRFPPCPVYALTGLYCPGCGTARALHDLAHLDLLGALGMNPLLIAYLPIGIYVWAAWLGRSIRGVPKLSLAPAWLIWVQIGAIMVFWIARNIPALQPWLAP